MTRSLIQRSISKILIALIALFAITTTGNVADFIGRYHAGWTGWTLGGCFGVTVFVSAYIMATSRSRTVRGWALVVGVTFALASASFQMSLYLRGGATWYIAGILAFVPILAGEVGLALVESSYSREHAEKVEQAESERLRVEVEDLQTQLKRSKGLVEGLAEAKASLEAKARNLEIDLAKAEAQRLGLVEQLEAARSQVQAPAPSVSEPARVPEDGQTPTTTDERRIEVLARLIQTNAKVEFNFAQTGRELGTSDQTIRNDLKWLIDQGYWANGSDWKPTQTGLGLLGE